jgi:hypothetical protein
MWSEALLWSCELRRCALRGGSNSARMNKVKFTVVNLVPVWSCSLWGRSDPANFSRQDLELGKLKLISLSYSPPQYS